MRDPKPKPKPPVNKPAMNASAPATNRMMPITSRFTPLVTTSTPQIRIAPITINRMPRSAIRPRYPSPRLPQTAAVPSARVTAPLIDLLAADFYLDGAHDAYAWMREHAPVHYDAANDLWGVATHAGVKAV